METNVKFFNKYPLQVVDGVFDFLELHDDYVENYDLIAKEDLKKPFTPDEVKDVIFNFCELLMPQSSKVRSLVDVGCGDGYIISKINALEKIAIDISIENLLRIPPSIIRIRANVEQIPLKDHCVDTIICTDVFEHVQNEKLLANELERILKPGGQILFAVPWEQDLSVYDSEEYITKYKKFKYVHLRSVDSATIQDCFPQFEIFTSTLITVGMKYMTIKPYPIRFIQLLRK